MITILHGDDIASSRKHYITERQKAESPIVFEGESIELSNLIQSAEGNGLFSEEKKIFIEKLLSKKGKSDEVVMYLKKPQESFDITLWEEKEISKNILSGFKNAKVLRFNLPKELFYFLEQIKPQSQKNLELFHIALQGSDVGMVLFMLIRQLRILLALAEPAELEEIEEVRRLQEWQKNKLKPQLRFFTTKQLKAAYQKLYEIDLKTKTGKLSLTPLQALDFFLLEL